MCRSGRIPSFAIVWKCLMVSPQETHSMVSVVSGAGGKRSMVGAKGV
jgi:hypothetical protein